MAIVEREGALLIPVRVRKLASLSLMGTMGSEGGIVDDEASSLWLRGSWGSCVAGPSGDVVDGGKPRSS